MKTDPFVEAFSAKPAPYRPPCKVCKYLATLSPAHAEALRNVLGPQSGWTHQQITDKLAELGFPVAEETIRKHRVRHV